MKFRVKVQNMKGNSWWEEYDKQIGEANTIRGPGTQPEFTGDIQAWGIAIVEWFNKDASPDGKRRFLAAELIQENDSGSTVTDRPRAPVASQRRGDRPKSRGGATRAPAARRTCRT